MAGLFFSFDGIDGTGKSTQIKLFCDWLTESGHDVVMCRDPGTTALGEQLRQIVLRSEMPIGARSETLLYMASRAQLVEEVIRPSLTAGKIVVSDRYLLANVVYQAHGLSLVPADVYALGEFATEGIYPVQTFLLDLNIDLAQGRLSGDADRLEQRDREYRARVRNGFLSEAARHPHVISVIDAGQSVRAVHAKICELAKGCLTSKR